MTIERATSESSTGGARTFRVLGLVAFSLLLAGLLLCLAGTWFYGQRANLNRNSQAETEHYLLLADLCSLGTSALLVVLIAYAIVAIALGGRAGRRRAVRRGFEVIR